MRVVAIVSFAVAAVVIALVVRSTSGHSAASPQIVLRVSNWGSPAAATARNDRLFHQLAASLPLRQTP